MRQETYPPWVRQFLLPVTIFLLLLLVPYLLRPVAQVLFAVFAGVLLSIFLDGSAALLRRGIPIPRGAALGIVILLIFLVFSGLLWVVTGQFLMGVLLGFYGVLLATPLFVLFTVLVQMLYIQDVLGKPVQTLGDRSGKTDQGEKK